MLKFTSKGLFKYAKGTSSMNGNYEKFYKRAIRLLILLDSSFPFRGGGRETGIFHIAKFGLDRLEIKAITMSPPKGENDIQFPDAYKYIKFYHTFSLQSILLARGYNKFASFFDNIIFPILAVKKANSICQKWRPDVVLCVHAGPLGAAAIEIAKRFRCASVLNIRSFYSKEMQLTSELHRPFLPIFKRIENKVINDIDLILANGEDTYQFCKNKFDRSKQVEIVFNGVDAALFKPKKYSDVREILGLKSNIVFISNNPMRSIKGPQDAISALAKIPKSLQSSCRIIFFGSHLSSLQFKNYAKELGVNHLILWLPRVRHEELPAYLSAADIALHPVLFSAGTTHASLETIACGLPQISYDSASLRTTCVNGKTGILVRKGNIDELAKAMVELATNKGLRSNMSIAARNLSLKFDWSIYVKNYLLCIEKNITCKQCAF